MAIRVVIVDDHVQFRQSLRGLVNEAPDCEVIGEAPDGASAVRLVRELKPNAVLMDVQMPLMDGIDATAQIAQENGAPAIIVLTVSSSSNDVLDAIAAGAAGYLLKGASGDEIHGALRAVREGRSPLSPEVTGTLLQHVRQAGAKDSSHLKLPELSEREEELLRLLARGADNNQIAGELFLSPATVKSNMSTLFEKLGVKSRVQAAVLAVRAGLA